MADNTLDRLKSSIKAMVRVFSGAELDYFAYYAARVVSQSGNKLDLTPDDTRIPGMTSVPMRLGIPGITATVEPGSRVLLGWEGGNPQKPIATAWESSSVTTLNVTAGTIVLNGGTQNVARSVVDKAGPYPIKGGNNTVKA